MRHACPPPTSTDQPGPSSQAAERSQCVYVLVCVRGGACRTLALWRTGGIKRARGRMSWEWQGAAGLGAERLCNGQSTAVSSAAKQSHSCPVDLAPGSKVLTCPRLGLLLLGASCLPPHTIALPEAPFSFPRPRCYLISHRKGMSWV